MKRFSKNISEVQSSLMNSRYEPEKIKGKKRPFRYESDVVITLDLECTSGFMDPKTKEIEGYKKGKSEAYWNSKIPVCVPYIWMVAIEDDVYYGRELGELRELFEVFPSDTHFICYVHNLGYDFSFLQNEFDFIDVFGREERHPMKATFDEFKNIELRCSYTLTQLKLEAWGKKLGLPKAVGELDYNIIRTPLTSLTEKELFYCERDVQVMVKGLREYKKKYLHLKDVPLTQTGEVRIPIRNMVLSYKKLHKKIVKLIPKNNHMYDLMKKAFAGGYTHANFIYVKETIKDGGSHYDFASSYPAVMCSEKFPMSPFVKDIFDKTKIDEKAYLMKVRYEHIRASKYNHYISVSKCTKKSENGHFNVDNGRLISADYIETVITEQDYLIIKDSYKYSRMEVLECYSSKKEYLPKCIVEFVLNLYANKTMYKDVEEMIDVYNQSKQFINSVFGMMVTDFLYDAITYMLGHWDTVEKKPEEVEKYLDELRGSKENQVFLAYQWGVWITAYARKNLWDCILENDSNVVYDDTDSIFMIGEADFSWYNERITNKLKVMCETYDIDFSLTRPKTPKGKEKPLGIFERETDWSEFCTLGAKRYCYRERPKKDDNDIYGGDGKLHLTVAGINKDAVLVLNDDIENFTEETVFDKDFQISNGELKNHPVLFKYYDENESDGYVRGVNKKLVTYVDNMGTVVWGDGYVSTYNHGIVMRPTSYSMSMAEMFITLITATSGVKRNFLKCIG